VTVEAEHTPDIDPGLFILLLSLRLRGVDAEVEKVRRLYADPARSVSPRCCAVRKSWA
jgi:hypothetical protein